MFALQLLFETLSEMLARAVHAFGLVNLFWYCLSIARFPNTSASVLYYNTKQQDLFILGLVKGLVRCWLVF